MSQNTNKNISHKSISGFLWLLSSSAIKSILQIVIIGVLARILTPLDFGLFATCIIITKFVEMIVNVGVGPALIQKKEINERHISTAFTFVIFLGITFYILLLILSSNISLFFNNPELKNILNLVSVVIPFSMFSQISYSLLQKRFKFKKIAGWDVLSYFLGYGIVGITLASLDWGVYALIWASIVQLISYSFFLFFISPYSFKIKIYKKEMGELLSKGIGFSMADFFNYFARNGDYIIIGKFLGPEWLGLYSRAYTLMNVVDKMLGQIINKVMFSTFSEIQNNKNEVIRVLNRSIGLLFCMLIPISSICYLYANEIINILLGPGWNNATVAYKILVIGMTFRVGYKLLAACIKGVGGVYQNMLNQFIYMLLVVLGSYLLKENGISGVALAVFFALCIHFLSQIIYLKSRGFLKLKYFFIKIAGSIPLALLIIFISLMLDIFILVNFSPIGSFFIFIAITLIICLFLIRYKFRLFITVDIDWLKQKIFDKIN